MKKVLSLIITLIFIITNMSVFSYAQVKVNDEMRAAWITTVHNQDWPSASNKNNIQNQKEEFIKILDDLKDLGFNAVVVQVRPKGDAIYNSDLNPWSDVLTGKQGRNPGYDPLSFMIEEAHNRGMEFHAWFNPYRITTTGSDISVLSEEHFARQNPELTMIYEFKKDGKLMSALNYNPGLPEVRKHIVDSVSEVVRNYDIDAIHFDDYFYPSGTYNDNDAYAMHGNGMNKNDWRRENTNLLVKEVNKAIKNIDSNVDFGISPRGIWKNQSSDSSGSETNGGESYYDIYCDTRTWIRNGWIDYVTPQIYWEIGNSVADYSKLVKWWSNEVDGYKTKLYIGQGIYKDEVAREIENQINLNRQYNNIDGSMYFSYIDIKNDRAGVREQIKIINAEKSNNTSDIPLRYNLEIKKFYGEESINSAMNTLKNDLGWYTTSEKIYYDATKYRIVTGEFPNKESAKNALNKLIDSTGWWATYEYTSNGKYRIVTGEFIGEENIINSLNKLKLDTGWWATYEQTSETNHVYEYKKFYRIVTGEFPNEESVKNELNRLIDLTGWWATYEPTLNGKYRIVTGEFNNEESVISGLDFLTSNTGWWAIYEETDRIIQAYKIITGYFPNEKTAIGSQDILLNKYGWFSEVNIYK